MASTFCKEVGVKGPNVLTVNGGREVYLPYCPLPGKEAKCEAALRNLVGNGVYILTDNHFSGNPLIYDAGIEGKGPLSDILESADLVMKWNIPREPGVPAEFPAR